jgi:hypothetical protein
MPIPVRDDDDDAQDGDFDDDLGDIDDPENLGPDERDRDLMDGTWEQKYYAGETRSRDWNAVYVGIALLFLIAIIVPAILVVSR